MSDAEHGPDHEPSVDAMALVRDAAQRGLARSRGLRLFASVVWSGFLGATAALAVVLLVPEGWLDPPVDLGTLSAVFALLWVLAIVPAFFQALLSAPPERQDGR